MSIKLGDSVVVYLMSLAFPNKPAIELPAKVLATHTYPDGTEIVSVKGDMINCWVPVENDIFKVVKA